MSGNGLKMLPQDSGEWEGQSAMSRQSSYAVFSQTDESEISPDYLPQEWTMEEIIKLYWIPRTFIFKIDEVHERKYELTVLQRVFVTFEWSSSR